MHSFGITVGVLLLVATAAAPWYFSFRQSRFFVSLGRSLMATGALAFIVAWWGDFAIYLELWWMGVNLEGLNAEERTVNVAPDLKEYAEELYFSPAIMGIGWPLKAIMTFVLAILPYTCAVCFGFFVARNLSRLRA